MRTRHRTLKTAAVALGVVAALAACSFGTGPPASGAADPSGAPEVSTVLPPVTSTISFPAGDLDWTELPDSGGVRYANTRGDLAGDGPYEAFVEFPAGADNPFHTHSADLPTVVLDGTFYAEIDGTRTEYGPGSYYDLPADLQHLSGCTAEKDCLLFQYQSDGFDLVPVG
jgi:anti-sigma factor ChrR (cupin superfamily)